MMPLSRAWFAALALGVVLSLAAAYAATGAYNTQEGSALTDRLEAGARDVATELKLGARQRLDRLVAGGADASLAQSLATANASKGATMSVATRLTARKALQAVRDGLGPDDRADALFAVDRDGRVVAQVGYDAVATNEEFELGGYPAVADALRGWARDDTWSLGSSLYLVTACPADYEPGQGPAGALVELKEVNAKLAEALARKTRTAVAFYVGSEGVASGAPEGFDRAKVKLPSSALKELVEQTASRPGPSDARLLSDDVAAAFVRLPGETWSSAAGFAVLGTMERASGPSALLGRGGPGAVPWIALLLLGVFASGVGVFLTVLEHTLPLRLLLKQSGRLKYGGILRLDGQRTAGPLKALVDDVNGSLDRLDAEFSARTAQNTTRQRKLPPLAGAGADGALSRAAARTTAAKDFPSSAGGSSRGSEGVSSRTPPPTGSEGVPSRTPPPTGSEGVPSRTPPPTGSEGVPSRTPPPSSRELATGAPRREEKNGAARVKPAEAPALEPSNTLVLRKSSPDIDPETLHRKPAPAVPDRPGASVSAPPDEPTEAETTLHTAKAAARAAAPQAASAPQSAPPSPVPDAEDADDKTSLTMQATAPKELLALVADVEAPAAAKKSPHGEATAVLVASQELLEAAGLTIRASAEMAPGMAQEAQQWKQTFDDYVRMKKERGEPVTGLTFDNFVESLRKNRDAIVASHKCKAVKFSVAVTNGKVTLKAAPVS